MKRHDKVPVSFLLSYMGDIVATFEEKHALVHSQHADIGIRFSLNGQLEGTAGLGFFRRCIDFHLQ